MKKSGWRKVKDIAVTGVKLIYRIFVNIWLGTFIVSIILVFLYIVFSGADVLRDPELSTINRVAVWAVVISAPGSVAQVISLVRPKKMVLRGKLVCQHCGKEAQIVIEEEE